MTNNPQNYGGKSSSTGTQQNKQGMKDRQSGKNADTNQRQPQQNKGSNFSE